MWLSSLTCFSLERQQDWLIVHWDVSEGWAGVMGEVKLMKIRRVICFHKSTSMDLIFEKQNFFSTMFLYHTVNVHQILWSSYSRCSLNPIKTIFLKKGKGFHNCFESCNNFCITSFFITEISRLLLHYLFDSQNLWTEHFLLTALKSYKDFSWWICTLPCCLPFSASQPGQSWRNGYEFTVHLT